MSAEEIPDILAAAFGSEPWPTPLRRFTGDRIHLRSLLNAARQNAPPDPRDISRTRMILGSLILGGAAERIFEAAYRDALSTTDVQLVDLRESRNDTDYRLLNGQGRPLYRLNIKFHGSLFRQAVQMVGLEPTDCFPLATYKIKSALDKQDQEHLPYLFVIVTGADTSAESIGAAIPDSLVETVLLGKSIIRAGRRRLEERVVDAFVASGPDCFADAVAQIEKAHWYVLSARRAESTMKAKLFERVYALRTRSFNRAYRNAEIDMHLSFAHDMIPLTGFLRMIKTEGHFKLAGMLERGTI